MPSANKGGPVSKAALWTGRVLSALPVLGLGAGGVFALIKPDEAAKGMVKYGYPQHSITTLAIIEIVCALVYAIPQTAVLGAILLTGYFGGAVATHVRADEKTWFIAVTCGVIVWLGLFLRDRRVRALLPFRSL